LTRPMRVNLRAVGPVPSGMAPGVGAHFVSPKVRNKAGRSPDQEVSRRRDFRRARRRRRASARAAATSRSVAPTRSRASARGDTRRAREQRPG
jgi:hypothetical protein